MMMLIIRIKNHIREIVLENTKIRATFSKVLIQLLREWICPIVSQICQSRLSILPNKK